MPFEYIFNLNLLLLAADHCVTGGLALLFPRTGIRVYRILFGASLPETPEYFTILKPWGALGLFAGFIGILPIFDPVRFEPILYGLLFLLIVRLFMRGLSMSHAKTHFGVSFGRSVFHISLIALCALFISLQLLVSR